MLTKYYLDELPQLINVLLGQMSMVGPRPRIPFAYERDKRKGDESLKYLRGGLTGARQITKGTDEDSRQRNIDYLGKCGSYSPLRLLFYDTGIIFKSVRKVIKGEGL